MGFYGSYNDNFMDQPIFFVYNSNAFEKYDQKINKKLKSYCNPPTLKKRYIKNININPR
jgi:hypothetical protein